MAIPRFDSDFVQSVLNDESIDKIHTKAYMIHKYDYDMACRECDGYLPKLMRVEEIMDEITELNKQAEKNGSKS